VLSDTRKRSPHTAVWYVKKKLFINVPFLIGIFLWVRVYGWSRCLISDWCTLIRSSHTATCWYNFCKLSRTSDPGVLSAVDVHIYGRLWSNLNLILFVSFVLFALARHCYSNFLFNLLFHHTLLKSPQPRLSHVHHLFRIRTTSVVGIVNPLSVVRLRQLQSSDRGKKAVEKETTELFGVWIENALFITKVVSSQNEFVRVRRSSFSSSALRFVALSVLFYCGRREGHDNSSPPSPKRRL